MDIKSRIQDKVRKGMKPKMAIAKSLAEDYKAKKMAAGGLVESQQDSDDAVGADVGEPTYPMHDDEQGLSPNVMSAQELAEGLQAARYKANDNSVSYEADDSVAGSAMSADGLEDEAGALHSELGPKPSQDRAGPTEEPLSSAPMKPGDERRVPAAGGMGLSEDAKRALMAKKAKRKFIQ